MLVVLDKSGRLFEVFSAEMVLKNFDKFWYHGDTVFTDDDSFHLYTSNLRIPLMDSDVCNRNTLLWLCIEDLLQQVFKCHGEVGRNFIITGQDLLVQNVCVLIFKRKVTASHRVEDNTARPNI